jgi:hypothetical protein
MVKLEILLQSFRPGMSEIRSVLPAYFYVLVLNLKDKSD